MEPDAVKLVRKATKPFRGSIRCKTPLPTATFSIRMIIRSVALND